MKVFIATMLCEDEVADHNAPTIIAAGSEAILLSKVREHVKNTFWQEAMGVNAAEVDTMSINDMNEKLCPDEPEDEDDYDAASIAEANAGRCILTEEQDI